MIPCCLKTIETVIPPAAPVTPNCVADPDAAWGICFSVDHDTADPPRGKSEALEAQVAVAAARGMTVPRSTRRYGKHAPVLGPTDHKFWSTSHALARKS